MTRHNPIKTTGAHISVTGHITPEELYDRFNHTEMANGFGNRFLWFYVNSDKMLPCCEPIPDKLYAKYAARLRRLNNLPAANIKLAPPAMGLWKEEIYPALRVCRPGMSGALLARGESRILRTALIYFLTDTPLGGVSQGVGVAHLKAAMAVWDYCERSITTLFQTVSGSPLGDKVIGMLSDRPMTKKEMNRHLSVKQKGEIDKVLSELEAAGVVVQEKEKKAGAGRPAIAWSLCS
jgi:hypothetical protein